MFGNRLRVRGYSKYPIKLQKYLGMIPEGRKPSMYGEGSFNHNLWIAPSKFDLFDPAANVEEYSDNMALFAVDEWEKKTLEGISFDQHGWFCVMDDQFTTWTAYNALFIFTVFTLFLVYLLLHGKMTVSYRWMYRYLNRRYFFNSVE